jgi:hypothetical protein
LRRFPSVRGSLPAPTVMADALDSFNQHSPKLVPRREIHDI